MRRIRRPARAATGLLFLLGCAGPDVFTAKDWGPPEGKIGAVMTFQDAPQPSGLFSGQVMAALLKQRLLALGYGLKEIPEPPSGPKVFLAPKAFLEAQETARALCAREGVDALVVGRVHFWQEGAERFFASTPSVICVSAKAIEPKSGRILWSSSQLRVESASSDMKTPAVLAEEFAVRTADRLRKRARP